MGCKPCAARAAARGTQPAAWRTANAVDAGTGKQYEVLTASGTVVNRRFDTLVAATDYARRIGGSTRPASGA